MLKKTKLVNTLISILIEASVNGFIGTIDNLESSLFKSKKMNFTKSKILAKPKNLINIGDTKFLTFKAKIIFI